MEAHKAPAILALTNASPMETVLNASHHLNALALRTPALVSNAAVEQVDHAIVV
jgi:hypothetical protein